MSAKVAKREEATRKPCLQFQLQTESLKKSPAALGWSRLVDVAGTPAGTPHIHTPWGGLCLQDSATAELHILKTAKGTWRSGHYSTACGAKGKGFLLMVPLESLWAKVKVEVCPEELGATTSHPDAYPSRLQSKCSPSEDENTRNLKKRCEGAEGEPDGPTAVCGNSTLLTAKW